MRSTCEIVRSSPQVLAKLSDLSPSAAILYLTPVVIPAGTTRLGVGTDSDPFEPLGRCLNGHHQRVRHVPYHPHVGLTTTHELFLKEADVVVAVTCQPNNRWPDESMAQQADFASSIVEALGDHTDPVHGALAVLVQFGQEDRCPDVAVFDNVFRCGFYTATTAQHMAHLMFSGRYE